MDGCGWDQLGHFLLVGEDSLLYIKNRPLSSCLQVASVSKRVSARNYYIRLKMCSAYRFGIFMQIKLMYEHKLETQAQGNARKWLILYCS